MENGFYSQLLQKALSNEPLAQDEARCILTSEKIDLLLTLNVAYTVRKKYFGKEITLHVINNVQNGQCSEDCRYCAQSLASNAHIHEYAMKTDLQIMDEAKQAYESGAHRYCLVFSGRSMNQERAEHLSRLIRKIKSAYPIQVCVSHGFVDNGKAQVLKQAGLDRLNHNLNSSNRFYSDICTTHGYKDRIKTLQEAHNVNLQVCSGIIIGMGETEEDIYDMACSLRGLKAESIPINFYIPVQGSSLNIKPDLSPEYCLRVLCLFRLMNPDSEIRLAAGREVYLKDMQPFAFYPANSLFINGYLNVEGESRLKTYERIKAAGFSIKSAFSLEQLIEREKRMTEKEQQGSKDIPRYVMRFIEQNKYIGKIKAPDGSAHIKGPCGDEMAVYLSIREDVLTNIKFQTNGCFYTNACGTMTADLSIGRKIQDVLQLSPGKIIQELKFLPKDHCHCVILAVSTLFKAIADYWLNGDKGRVME